MSLKIKIRVNFFAKLVFFFKFMPLGRQLHAAKPLGR
jgi:hypothetical protein